MRRHSILIAALLALGMAGAAVLVFYESSGRGARSPAAFESASDGQPDTDGRGDGRAGGPAGTADGSRPFPAGSGKRGAGPDGVTAGARGAPGEAKRAGPGAAAGSGPDAEKGNREPGAAGKPGEEILPPLGSGTATIAVLVVDPDGRPVPGAAVEARGKGGARTVPSGKDGVAELGGIPAGGYEVKVKVAGLPALRTARAVEAGDGQRTELRCQIPSFDGEITGRVLDSSGQTLAGIEIEARAIGFPGTGGSFVPEGPAGEGGGGPVKSDRDGSFRFSGLARVEHSLITRETSMYPSARAVAIAGRTEPVDLVIAARQDLVIGGIVTDDAGNPVPAAEVRTLTHAANPVTTDSEGRFKIEVKYERGAVALAATKKDFAQGETIVSAADIAEQEDLEVAIRLDPVGKTGEVAGRIVDTNGQPIPRQVVHLYSSSLNASYQAASADDGSFDIRDIRVANDYRAWVNPDRDYRDFSQSPFNVEEGLNRLDVTLDALEGGHISGVMVDPSGRPVPRLTLYVRSRAATANAVPVTGDDSGRFSADDVPAGDLFFETRAAPFVSIHGVRLEAGDSLDVQLPVGLGEGTLAGTVVSGTGTPVAGAHVTLNWSTSKGTIECTIFREAAADTRGKFLFSGLSRGRGAIGVTAAGFSDYRAGHELTGGNEDLPPIVLKPSRQD